MSIELITGHAGTPHVSSEDVGDYNASTGGAGRYILEHGDGFSLSIVSATTVTVGTGNALFDGRHVRSVQPTDLTVDPGSQGYKRIDLVGILYSRDGSGVESVEMRVFKGTPALEPELPVVPSGSILSGDNEAFMPLWRLDLDGITLSTVPLAMAATLPSAGTMDDRLVSVEGSVQYVNRLTSSQVSNELVIAINAATGGGTLRLIADASKLTFQKRVGGTTNWVTLWQK